MTLERRTPLQRGKPPKRTAMKASSKGGRRARPDDALAENCQAVTVACTGRAEVRHHKAGRGKPGTAAAVELDKLTLDVCDACHRWIHAHSTVSYDMGWMLHRHGRVLP